MTSCWETCGWCPAQECINCPDFPPRGGECDPIGGYIRWAKPDSRCVDSDAVCVA